MSFSISSTQDSTTDDDHMDKLWTQEELIVEMIVESDYLFTNI